MRAHGHQRCLFPGQGLGGKAAFESTRVPMVCPGRDLLRETLIAAKDRGMRLHAWLTSASDRHYLKNHQEGGLHHLKRGKSANIVSLADTGYISYMQAVVDSLTRKYALDGIHLDYVRYNHLLYGWSAGDLLWYERLGAQPDRLLELVQRSFPDGQEPNDLVFDAYRQGDADVLALAEGRKKRVYAFAKALVEPALA